MKILCALRFWSQTGLLLTFLALLGAGCASTSKPDWNARIGNYTFDDAVRELGRPVSSTKLQDGTNVAEWLLKFGSQMPFGYGTGRYGPGEGASMGTTFTPPTQSQFLRLTFGTDGKLQRWNKFER